MKYQLVPPHDHRRNIAEKAIQVFKDYFVSVLCGTDDNFPLQLWCQILRHVEHQLNLLQNSRVVPTILAFAHMYRQHDYDSHPFAVLCSTIELHVMPNKRKTWAAHTMTGYYLGALWEHYRCHQVWISETKSKLISQTVFFKHKYLTQPTITATDALLQASNDICNALKNIAPPNDKSKQAIDFLVNIFKGQAATEQTNTNTQRVQRKTA